MSKEEMRKAAHRLVDQMFDDIERPGNVPYAVAVFVEAEVPGYAKDEATILGSSRFLRGDTTDREAREFLRGVYQNARKLRDQRGPIAVGIVSVDEE